MYDLSGDVGGPIVKERARFYGSYRDNSYYNTVAGLPGVETQSRLMNATAKIDYAFNTRNSLIGFYSWRYKLDAGRGISAAVPLDSTQYQDGRMHLAKLEWTSILSNRLFLDVQGGPPAPPTAYEPADERPIHRWGRAWPAGPRYGPVLRRES